MSIKRLQIPIRTFVENLFLEDYVISAMSPRRAQEGMAYHLMLQRSREEGYRAEVPVEFVYPGESLELVLGGRIDGLEERGESVCIEEIKTTYRSREGLGEGEEVHWAQAKAYGAIFARDHELEYIALRLIYVLLPSEEQYVIEREYSALELLLWLEGLCHDFLIGAQREYLRRELAMESIRAMEFPYPNLRDGQKIMMDAIYEQAVSGGQLYVEAPTGIGKTIAALYPGLKALGHGHVERVFYLTARTTVRAIAAGAFEDLLLRGLQARCTVLWAKETLCPNPGRPVCHPAYCPRAAGMYTRLGAALEELPQAGCFSRAYIEELALRHMLCPHELALAMADVSEIVVCDYNNAFDPRAKIQRYFTKGGAYLLLIDEAHNLVDRARDMFSCTLPENAAREMKRLLPKVKDAPPREKHIRRDLNALLKAMGALQREMEEDAVEAQVLAELPEALSDAILAVQGGLMEYLAVVQENPYGDAMLDLFYACRTFSMLYEEIDAASALVSFRQGRELLLEIQCIDPAPRLTAAFVQVGAAILFSATLQPFSYYDRLLGGNGEGATLSLPSPFDPQNRCMLHIPADTTMLMREFTVDSIVRALRAMVEGRQGNYFAFFPSYAYLRRVHEAFCAACPDVYAPAQRSQMAGEARDAFLALFEEPRECSMLAFAVLGGIFGEGIDLASERLIGVAVVGVGLPGVSFQRELIRQYHENLFEDGFAFAYRIPGLNRVRQAAGRLIRTEEDRGIVLLIDRRYSLDQYRALLPEDWRPLRTVENALQMRRRIEQFWGDEAR